MAIDYNDPNQLDAETKEVIALLRQAAAKCQRIMLNPPGGTDNSRSFNSSRAAQQLKSINDELARVNGRLANVAANKIKEAFEVGLKEGDRQAAAAGVRSPGSAFSGSFNMVDSRRAQVLASQQKLAQETVNDLHKSVVSIRENTGKVVRQCQALGIDNVAVNRLLAGATIEGVPKVALEQLRADIQKLAIDGKIITVNRETGVMRSFTVDHYTELVFRTKIAETTTAALMEKLISRRLFYVQVIGNDTANFCTLYLDKVFYIGPGEDPLGLYPSNRALPRGGPPFHPNCSKRFVAYIPQLATPAARERSRFNDMQREYLDKTPAELQAIVRQRSQNAAVAPAARPAVTPQESRPTDMRIADPSIAASARRAIDLVRSAGHATPPIWRDNPSVFTGAARNFAFAGYASRSDDIFINPNCVYWSSAEATMRSARARNHSSTDHPDHPCIHEIGHYLHRHSVGLDRYSEIRSERFSAPEKRLITRHVSEYGATQPVELVAEVFTMKIVGREIHPRIKSIYDRLGGP